MPNLNVLSNANIYMEGNNFAGKAKEIELPEIELKMEEFDALGLYGTPELPNGIEPMEGTITWSSFYREVAEKVADFSKATNMQVRGSVEEFGTNGRSNIVPYVVTMRAIFKKNPLGSFATKELAEFESDISVYYVKQVYGGRTILEFDVFNNIYKVNGVDLLARFRTNLGL
jgi:uncharacterized protein